MTIITYEQARKEPELRQAYLDTLLAREHPPAVSDLHYDPGGDTSRAYLDSLNASNTITYLELMSLRINQETLINNEGYGFMLPVMRLIGNNSPNPVFIQTPAFDDFWHESEFKGVIYHEFSHADDIAYGIRIDGEERLRAEDITEPEFARAVTEFNAYLLQLNTTAFHRNWERERVRRQLIEWYGVIQSIPILSPKEKTTVDAKKREYQENKDEIETGVFGNYP